MRKLLFLLTFLPVTLLAQLLTEKSNNYTLDDSLRGSITPQRVWWNLLHYSLDLDVKPDSKYLSGSNTITYEVLTSQQVLQIDLQPPLTIDKVSQDGEALSYEKIGKNAYMVTLRKNQQSGDVNQVRVYYSGLPKEAVRAPWDGGVSWKKDDNGKHFVATSCQGLGASVWWPCKDHMYDEPERGMDLSVTVPQNLMDVSNGRLESVLLNSDGTRTYNWKVTNPINNYGVNINIADYAKFSEIYEGERGKLDMDYYVLSYNLEKAKEHFKDARKMMEAFEHWFGPYPFYEDGYKLVEVPYLGMEHQSSITYGNKYMKGYLGRDLSGTGQGLKWDFIIIHESGHEWFANNITYKDIADMWIHEGFTNYSENLFIEYHEGKAAGHEYIIGCRRGIKNDRPIIGDYDVNKEGSGDMYPKAANMLHSIRYIVDNDEKWRAYLRGLNKDFYHQTVTTEDIEQYSSNFLGVDLSKVFDQYLRTTKIPTLECKTKKGKISYRWINVVDGFNMPVRVSIDEGELQLIKPTTTFQELEGTKLEIDENFYVFQK
jgi:aminopeptidase N